ncbi:MAG TPA: adenylate/guanylate cyclase domain-containing protein [Polyangiaceae bacterium]|nr:adenylate/guanylate cyclase domain-containing protein [Polyangiaceae bacterium]
MDKLTLAELGAVLDGRNTHPETAEELDREVWERCGAERGILVMDLSGFTRLTRARGILHFLAVFRRAWRASCPVVSTHGGRVVKCEADNVIASFPSASAALDAAVGMLHAVRELNVTLDDDSRMRLCIAVGWGRILELEDDFFGDEVNVTFKLGEDVARSGEVLVTESAVARLETEGRTIDGEELSLEVGSVRVRYRRLVPGTEG